MAVVTRYFSPTAAAGSGDGTSWANRALLISAGTWSAVLTGFAFNGSDSLLAYIGPGTATVTAALASGLFANPPSAANQLFLYACDSSGSALSPPDPNYTSDQPAWDYSGLPVLSSTTNVATLNLDYCNPRLLNITATGRTSGAVVIYPTSAAGTIDWCRVSNTASNSSAGGISGEKVTNCLVEMGTQFAYGITARGGANIFNVRLTASGGGSGNRDGVVYAGTTSGSSFRGLTIVGFAGSGITSSSSNTGQSFAASRCTILSCGTGIKMASTASQVANHSIGRCYVANCTTGIDAQSAARVILANTRLRDNTTNLSGFGNFPQDTGVYTTDSDDATEFVASGSGNYQIKRTAAIWGQGYGVSEESGGGRTISLDGGFTMLEAPLGATDYTELVFLQDSTGPVTGLVAADIDITFTRVEDDNDVVADATASPSDLASLTAAHSDWGLKEEGSGWYRLDFADAVFATGAKLVGLRVVRSSDSTVLCALRYRLVPVDPSTGVNAAQVGGTAVALDTDTATRIANIEATANKYAAPAGFDDADTFTSMVRAFMTGKTVLNGSAVDVYDHNNTVLFSTPFTTHGYRTANATFA